MLQTLNAGRPTQEKEPTYFTPIYRVNPEKYKSFFDKAYLERIFYYPQILVNNEWKDLLETDFPSEYGIDLPPGTTTVVISKNGERVGCGQKSYAEEIIENHKTGFTYES